MLAKEIYKNIFDKLKDISTEPEAETSIILEKIFDINKFDLITNKDINIDNQAKILEATLTKRINGIPLQYIFNEQYFRSYKLYVDERVLIPRPETEILVDKVIEIADKYFSHKDKINIADIGCGSGAIAISLALEIKKSEVYTTDISNDALEVAKINAKNLNVPENKLFFIEGDKLEPFRKNNDSDKKKFDIIVSNPPYIPYDEYINLEKEVFNNEPKLALLDDNEDGLGFYQYFAQQADNFLESNGFVAFEVGHNQAEKVKEILYLTQKFANIEIIRDYNGISRIVTARQNNENFTG